MVGLLLSDGYMAKLGNGYALYFKQSVIHKDFFMDTAQLLYDNGYISGMSFKIHRNNKKNGGNLYYSLNTFRFGSLGFLHTLFYDTNGVKFISPDLELYITPVSLAYVFL